MDITTRLRLENQLRDRVDAWLAQVVPTLAEGPQSPTFPLSALFLAPTAEPGSSIMSWLLLANTQAPNRPKDWLQALHLSRDLCMLLQRLNVDYQLGLDDELAQLQMKHPLSTTFGDSGAPH